MPRDVPAPDPLPPRLTGRAFPAYRYVPGLHPHPVVNPEGHSHHAPPPERWDGSLPWEQDEAWLHGLDLFNHRYWWEAHEHLEGLWHQVRRSQPLTGHGVQGLIQVAVCLLKRHMGNERAYGRLRERGLAHLAHVGPVWRGIDVVALERALMADEVPVLGLTRGWRHPG